MLLQTQWLHFDQNQNWMDGILGFPYCRIMIQDYNIELDPKQFDRGMCDLLAQCFDIVIWVTLHFSHVSDS